MTFSSQPPTNAIQSILNENVTGRVVLKLGDTYLWTDTNGVLRISGGNAAGDTEGTVVGAQT